MVAAFGRILATSSARSAIPASEAASYAPSRQAEATEASSSPLMSARSLSASSLWPNASAEATHSENAPSTVSPAVNARRRCF